MLIFCEEFIKRFIWGNNEFFFLFFLSCVVGICCIEDCVFIFEFKMYVCYEEIECSLEMICKYFFFVFLGY